MVCFFASCWRMTHYNTSYKYNTSACSSAKVLWISAWLFASSSAFVFPKLMKWHQQACFFMVNRSEMWCWTLRGRSLYKPWASAPGPHTHRGTQPSRIPGLCPPPSHLRPLCCGLWSGHIWRHRTGRCQPVGYSPSGQQLWSVCTCLNFSTTTKPNTNTATLLEVSPLTPSLSDQREVY